MDGLDKILKQICDEAKSEAETTLNDANLYKQTKLDEANAEALRIKQKAVLDAEHSTSVTLARASSIRRTEERKVDLISRQKAVSDIISRAMERFCQTLGKSERVSLYARLLAQSDLRGGVIKLAKTEADLGNSLLALLGDGYEVSPELGDFAAGVVLVNGDIIENFTVDLIVRQHATELSAIVAQTLFVATEG